MYKQKWNWKQWNEYDEWLANQPKHTQNWLKNQPIWHDIDLIKFGTLSFCLGLLIGLII